jgi:hypothetical protein
MEEIANKYDLKNGKKEARHFKNQNGHSSFISLKKKYPTIFADDKFH